jgi:gamma-glutamyltranspeptidase
VIRNSRNGPFEHGTFQFAAAHARSAMVASSQSLAAQVGLQVLNDGGNAVDYYCSGELGRKIVAASDAGGG